MNLTNKDVGVLLAVGTSGGMVGKLVNGPAIDFLGGPTSYSAVLGGVMVADFWFSTSAGLFGLCVALCVAQFFASAAWPANTKFVVAWFEAEEENQVCSRATVCPQLFACLN